MPDEPLLNRPDSCARKEARKAAPGASNWRSGVAGIAERMVGGQVRPVARRQAGEGIGDGLRGRQAAQPVPERDQQNVDHFDLLFSPCSLRYACLRRATIDKSSLLI